MKTPFRITVLLFWAYVASLQAQVTPMFQMPLYFEDSVGNRDTVFVGYDTLGSGSMVLPMFGEVEITNPFDSVFDVRTLHFDMVVNSYERQTTKICITNFELSGPDYICGGMGTIVIVISAKYPPVQITYDSTLLWDHLCNKNAVLSRDQGLFIYENWWDSYGYHCMGKTSSIELRFTEQLHEELNILKVELPVEGKGMVELPGYFMTIYPWGACSDPTLPVKAAAGKEIKVQLSPNPVSDICQIQFNDPIWGQLSLFDLSGRVQSSIRLEGVTSWQLDTSRYAEGLFQVQIIDNRHFVWSAKLAVFR